MNVPRERQERARRSSLRLSEVGKQADHVDSREGVFVSLPKGMKNRESSQGFELTRTARAARFLTHTPDDPVVPSPSTLSPVSINRLPGVGGGLRRKNRNPCFNKVAFTSFGGRLLGAFSLKLSLAFVSRIVLQ